MERDTNPQGQQNQHQMTADTVTEADINAQMQDVLVDAQQAMPSMESVNNPQELQNHHQMSADTATEADINAQMQDVRNEAHTLQSSDNNEQLNQQAPRQETPVPEQESVNVSKMMSGAQSAIARILANRNISGTGKLSAPSNNKAEQTTPVNNESVVKKTEPQRGELEIIKKPELRVNKPRQKQQRHERIKSDPANLAPELLVQISGETQQVEEVIEQVIEIPEGFVSPLSDIKFAYQKDHWAGIINNMQLGGRIRQFALHSLYQKQENHVLLNVDLSQQHLDSQMLRDQLQTSLSQVLNEAINLQVQFEGTVEHSPYLIQQKIDSDRLQHASEVLKQDPVITQFVSRFEAQMDESSVRTR